MIVITKDSYMFGNWEGQDAESLTLYFNNKRIWGNCRSGLSHPYTKEDARCFISQAREEIGISDFYIVVHGEVIGNIDFVRGVDVERFNMEVGYWISERYWNQGITPKALVNTTRYYFEHMEVIHIFATVHEYNLASMRVSRKVGFKKTGVSRKARCKNGRFIDAHYFEIVAGEELVGNRGL